MHEHQSQNEPSGKIKIYIMTILLVCSFLHFWSVKELYLRALYSFLK